MPGIFISWRLLIEGTMCDAGTFDRIWLSHLGVEICAPEVTIVRQILNFSFFWENSHNFWPNPPVCMFYSLKWPQSNALCDWCINFMQMIDWNEFYRFTCKIYDFQKWSFFVFFDNLSPWISFDRKCFNINIITSLYVVCMLYSIFRCGSFMEKHELL